MRSVFIIFIIISIPGYALSETIYVPDDYSKIQDAINASSTGDTIIVRSGTYVENIDFIGKAISIISDKGPEETVIDGNRSGTVVIFNSGEGLDSIIDGFTITNGLSSSAGGILCANYSAPKICNNHIINNVANENTNISGGGGILVVHASPHIINNLIVKNIAETIGGGIYIYAKSTYPLVANNTIYDNFASGSGGGVAIRVNPVPVLINNIVYDNLANAGGSEIYLEGAPSPDITYCDIKGGWPGLGNIDADPLWNDPSNFDYHLKQDPCQPGITNLCVNAGDPISTMIQGATRTDGVQDAGIVDMGYHYNLDTIHHVPGECPTIQNAIDVAMNDDLILVEPGTYIENINFHGKTIILRSDVDGEPGTYDIDPSNTYIDGSQIESVVKFEGGEESDTVISGFTILNGLSDYGGGIQCYESSPTISNNIIKENGVLYFGAGIGCSKNSDPLIENNIIYENIAYGQGGGIGCESSNPSIINTTIYGNSAVQIRGGGFWCWNSEPVIKNSILWNNDAPTGPEIFVANTPNPSILTISFSNVKGGEAAVGIEPGCTLVWGDGMIDQDPIFVDQQNGDLHLKWISPCINRGLNDGIPLFDIDGEARPQMGTVDMGADEFKGVHALETATFTLTEAGGTIDFDLHGGISNGNREYILLGSVTGTAPGNLLPGGYATMPLNWDLFTFMIIDFLNTPTFMNFHGTLSPLGHATATFDTLGPIVGTAGIMPSFAYALNAPWDFVSNPINIEIIP